MSDDSSVSADGTAGSAAEDGAPALVLESRLAPLEADVPADPERVPNAKKNVRTCNLFRHLGRLW
jgi:hypothetical protein